MSEHPVIHVGTEVVVTFGRVDGEGNVVDRTPLRFSLSGLDEETFRNLLAQIVMARVQLEAKLTPVEPEGDVAPV